MTRMAPKPTGYTRAAAPRASECTELRWRIERTGSLVLVAEPLSLGREGTVELAMQVRLERSRPDARRSADEAGQTFAGRGRLVETDGELAISVELGSPSSGQVAATAATIVLVDRPAAGEILTLTDLPARIGLRGGTYVLDLASARRGYASFRALLGRDS